MNSVLSEMLHCQTANSENTEMSLTYFNENEQLGDAVVGFNGDHGLCELVVNGAMNSDPSLENGLNHDFPRFFSYGYGSEVFPLPRKVSCPPNVAADIGKEAALMSSAAGRQSSKKRKADKTQTLKVVAEGKSEKKRMKGCSEEDSKTTEQNSTTSSTIAATAAVSTAANNTTKKINIKENSKVSEAPKTDYIHVRARRGQATDSHSLAERVRREKISERMKCLQDLVPGCNTITGKAGMLDEIINYVQSLQRQVEFLSMKLAAINPRLDFNVLEIFPASVPEMEASSSELFNHGNHSDAFGQGVLITSLDMVENSIFLDPNNITWEDELQNL